MEKRQEEREKEVGELEERTEERTEGWTEEGTEETEERIEDADEGLEVTEEACKEDERCDGEAECHSAANRPRVCATFTDTEAAPRAVRQGEWTFPRQTEEGGSLGRNLC